MKSGLIVLFCVSAMAQGWGRREAMRPWLEGRFLDAEREFAQTRSVLPSWTTILWEADYEIERARFGRATALIDDGQKHGPWQDYGLFEGRQARLFLTVGRFAEAQKAALGKTKWDGKDAKKLRLASVMDFVTLGEVALARGNFGASIAVLEKARGMSGRASSLYGPEWVRASNDIAIADIGLSSVQAASEVVTSALASAEREWGTGSIPALDSLDALGLVQLSQGEFQGAQDSLLRSRKWREELYSTNHPKVADSYIHCALFCAAQGQRDDAVRLLERGLQIQKAISAGPNGRWALALLVGAEIYAKAGRIDEATDCYASAIPILERELGADAPRLGTARKRYDELRSR